MQHCIRSRVNESSGFITFINVFLRGLKYTVLQRAMRNSCWCCLVCISVASCVFFTYKHTHSLCHHLYILRGYAYGTLRASWSSCDFSALAITKFYEAPRRKPRKYTLMLKKPESRRDYIVESSSSISSKTWGAHFMNEWKVIVSCHTS